jgi:carbon storage regulator
MLVLKRKVGEVVKIGNDIELHVLAVEGDVIKLGFEAPRHIQIMRSELYDAIRAENIQAGSQKSEQSLQLLNLLTNKAKDQQHP